MKKLLLLTSLLVVSFSVSAAPLVGSKSQSGALAGAASQAGAIGMIDQSVTTVDAVDMRDRAPGVFGAGVASGTNPCVVSVSGGLSIPGGGINFGSAYEDINCTVRESLRLMGAMSNSSEPVNQIFLREIACESVIFWDAMERTYISTDDDRYLCSSPRPNSGPVPIRQRVTAEEAQTAAIEEASLSETAYNWDFDEE